MSLNTKPDDVEVSYLIDSNCLSVCTLLTHLVSMFLKIDNYTHLLKVRFSDQEKINEFGRLNYRLIEVTAELKQSKDDNEKLDDASAELMMAGSEGKVMLLIGEAFIETDEDEANECMTFKKYFIVQNASRFSRLFENISKFPMLTQDCL